MNAAVAATFRLYGKPATYRPPASGGAFGDGSACRVIVNQADGIENLGSRPFIGEQRVVEVRVDEIAAPQERGCFDASGERLVIVAAPKRTDPDRLVWTCLCDPRGAPP